MRGSWSASTICCTAPGSESLNMLRASSRTDRRRRSVMTTTCCGAIRSKTVGEQAAVAERVAANVGGEGLRDGVRALEVVGLAGQQVERDQVGDHHGVGVRHCVVMGAAHAHDHVGRVVGGEGVAAAVGHPEVAVERGAPAFGRGEEDRRRWSPVAGAAPPRSCWRSRWPRPAPWPGPRARSGSRRPSFSMCSATKLKADAAAVSHSGRSNSRAA